MGIGRVYLTSISRYALVFLLYIKVMIKNSNRSVRYILCMNCGSSSLKFALYRMVPSIETLMAEGEAVRGRSSKIIIRYSDRDGKAFSETSSEKNKPSGAARQILEIINRLCLNKLDAVGHRIVHGGDFFTGPVPINPGILRKLDGLIPMAPLHMPESIEVIRTVSRECPGIFQAACFDTSFHSTLPDSAKYFSLPRALRKNGVRKYGFHGLSCEYIMSVLRKPNNLRLIILHLGNGASITAVRNGKSIDTTMGMTPTGGIMMGTRSGDLDPGILLYLMREKKMAPEQIDNLVNHEAGLMGVSGISSDMRTLLDGSQKIPEASETIDMFCYQIQKQIGAYIAVLGGLDAMVFTGGIGEKSSLIRQKICKSLKKSGIALDGRKNKNHAHEVSSPASQSKIYVIRTHENLMIARHAYKAYKKL